MMRPVPEEPNFRSTVERSGGRAVIAVAGELDLATADDFAATVRGELASASVQLDLRQLSFMDSSGVRVLDALLRDTDREGWSLTIHPDLQAPVRQVLELTGMLSVLPLQDPDGRAGA